MYFPTVKVPLPIKEGVRKVCLKHRTAPEKLKVFVEIRAESELFTKGKSLTNID